DVEHADARVASRVGGEPVDRPQEGGERLARSGGGGDERVPRRCDRAPGARLRRGGRGERGGEPGPRGERELGEHRMVRGHIARGARRTSSGEPAIESSGTGNDLHGYYRSTAHRSRREGPLGCYFQAFRPSPALAHEMLCIQVAIAQRAEEQY